MKIGSNEGRLIKPHSSVAEASHNFFFTKYTLNTSSKFLVINLRRIFFDMRFCPHRLFPIEIIITTKLPNAVS